MVSSQQNIPREARLCFTLYACKAQGGGAIGLLTNLFRPANQIVPLATAEITYADFRGVLRPGPYCLPMFPLVTTSAAQSSKRKPIRFSYFKFYIPFISFMYFILFFIEKQINIHILSDNKIVQRSWRWWWSSTARSQGHRVFRNGATNFGQRKQEREGGRGRGGEGTTRRSSVSSRAAPALQRPAAGY